MTKNKFPGKQGMYIAARFYTNPRIPLGDNLILCDQPVALFKVVHITHQLNCNHHRQIPTLNFKFHLPQLAMR